MTAALLVVLGITGSHGLAAAQSRGHVEARLSYLPLYGGDATVGSVQAWAWTAGAGLVLGPTRQLDIETFYTLSPRDDDPYNRAPRIQIAGILIGFWGGPAARWKPVGSVGFGLIHVGPMSDRGCEPPLCIDEGGPAFTETTLPLLTGRFGFDVRVIDALHLRLDGRLHVPLAADEADGDSGSRRLDIGTAILWFF